MTPIKIESYLTTIGKPKYNSQIEKERLKKTFKPAGYLYGPFRTPPSNWEPPNMEAYKILLMLRDPRDVLTSLYFSVAYSHSIIDGKAGKRQLDSRAKTLNKSIDEFVIDISSGYLERYNDYCENLLGKSNTFFVKYEDMVGNFNVWLNTIMTVLELGASQELQNKIIGEVDFNVPEENIYSHKRQVTPGDHKRKLQPETISILNTKFCKVLDLLGYAKE